MKHVRPGLGVVYLQDNNGRKLQKKYFRELDPNTTESFSQAYRDSWAYAKELRDENGGYEQCPIEFKEMTHWGRLASKVLAYALIGALSIYFLSGLTRLGVIIILLVLIAAKLYK